MSWPESLKGFAAMLFLACAGLLGAAELPQSPTNGQLHQSEGGSFVAWNAANQQWQSPDAFWLAYAAEQGGLTWGEGADYPPYDQVKEGDLFLVTLPSGRCLMEFFHQRWRRAQDVRRWDSGFNDYSGCPDVFK